MITIGQIEGQQLSIHSQEISEGLSLFINLYQLSLTTHDVTYTANLFISNGITPMTTCILNVG